MSQFAEQYKTLTNHDLLKIIDNPGDYQPIAVDTAKVELDSRELSEEELQSAKATNEAELDKKKLQNEKRKALGGKVKNIGFSIAETINPIQATTPSTDKIILRISIVFAILFLFQVINELGFIKFALTDSNSKWDLSMIAYFLPFIMLPIATFLFWKRRKSGWILLSIFLTYSILIVFATFLMELRINKNQYLSESFPSISPITYLGRIFLYSCCLWFICKSIIRAIYTIDKKNMVIALSIGTILSVLQMLI